MLHFLFFVCANDTGVIVCLFAPRHMLFVSTGKHLADGCLGPEPLLPAMPLEINDLAGMARSSL